MIKERKQIYRKEFPNIYKDMIMYRDISQGSNEHDPLYFILGVIECYLYYSYDRKETLKKCLSDLKSLDQQTYMRFESIYLDLIQIIDSRDINFLDNLCSYNNFWSLMETIGNSIESICVFDSCIPYKFLFKISCIFQVSMRITQTVESSDIKIIQYGNKNPIVDIFFSKEGQSYIMYPASAVINLKPSIRLDKVYHCGCHNKHKENCQDRRPYTIEDEPCSFYIVLGI